MVPKHKSCNEDDDCKRCTHTRRVIPTWQEASGRSNHQEISNCGAFEVHAKFISPCKRFLGAGQGVGMPFSGVLLANGHAEAKLRSS
jgi:hypothetical protein